MASSSAARTVRLLVAYIRAVLTIALEFVAGAWPIEKQRLDVRIKGVDKTLLFSRRASDVLRVFVDGSRVESGKCGFAVFYSEGHPMNAHGRIVASDPGSSNLAELAAIFWALLRHPRGQQLDVFSDSMHALNVVRSASEEMGGIDNGADTDDSGPSRSSSKRRSKHAAALRCPTLEPRERSLSRAIWWLLRLRTAQTSFYKVPAHKKGFTQNHFADALAHQGALEGPDHPFPLNASAWTLASLLVSYLVGQSELDGGAGAEVSPVEGDVPASTRSGARRPKPVGPSTDATPLVALDCEMVGVGAWGGESRLASVSIINEDGNQIYFSYAKPPKPVTDYRTKWSGIEKKHLVDAPPAKQVQAEVRKVVEGRIVVGHSLENDFRVLGFSPPREMMRDTAHDVRRLLSRSGRPRKLRHITWEFLGLTIQDRDDGHDPNEDALAALLLYRRFKDEFEARAAHHAAEARARRESMKAATLAKQA